ALAEKALREAVRLKPENIEAQFNWGLTLEMQGNHQAAAQGFRQILQANAQCGEAHYHLGRCLEMLGDETGALGAYRDAIRCQPEQVAYHQGLGILLARREQDGEAREVLEHALDLDPSHEETRRRLETVRRRMKSSGAETNEQ